MSMAAKEVNGLTFKQWQDAVERVVQRRLGVGFMDLADWRWFDAWQDEMTPAEAADEAIEYEFGG